MAERTSYVVEGPESPTGIQPVVMVASAPATHRTAAEAVDEFVATAAVAPIHTFHPAVDVDLPSGAKGREVRYDTRTAGGLIHCRMRVVILGTIMHSALLVFGDGDDRACLEGERTLLRWDPPSVLAWAGAASETGAPS